MTMTGMTVANRKKTMKAYQIKSTNRLKRNLVDKSQMSKKGARQTKLPPTIEDQALHVIYKVDDKKLRRLAGTVQYKHSKAPVAQEQNQLYGLVDDKIESNGQKRNVGSRQSQGNLKIIQDQRSEIVLPPVSGQEKKRSVTQNNITRITKK